MVNAFRTFDLLTIQIFYHSITFHLRHHTDQFAYPRVVQLAHDKPITAVIQLFFKLGGRIRDLGHRRAYNIKYYLIFFLCCEIPPRGYTRGRKKNINNGVFLYSAHTMLCALHTYYPWSLDLFIHGPFQFPFWEHAALAAISALVTNSTHCHLRPTRYLFTPELSEACDG